MVCGRCGPQRDDRSNASWIACLAVNPFRAARRGRVSIGAAVVVALLAITGCSSDPDVVAVDSNKQRTTPTLPSPEPSEPSDPTEPSDPGSSEPTETTESTDPTSTDPSASAGTIDWGPCDDELVTEDELECGTVTVPLDYEDPSGETVDIALVRVPARDDRQGAILFNPGGPGGSGFSYIAQGGTYIVDELGLHDFDLIGFDPRGVDRSDGLVCLSDQQLDDTAFLDDTPDDQEEQQALADADALFDEECVAKYGDALAEYSTINTARDMDEIRKALGDDQLSYLGISYGTYLGAVYASMFPDHVRAMALDSAFEPTGDSIEEQYTTQLVGFENAFNDWAAWCEDDETCAFTSDDVGADWDALIQQLDESPIENSDGRIGNQTLVEGATIAALYSESEWPVLATALADAREGDPAGLFRLADSYNGRREDGTYETIQQSNTIINCASGLQSPLPEDPEALVETLYEVAPRFSRTITVSDFDSDGCSGLMPPQPIDELHYDGDAPIVVIGGLNDPATPFRWAEEMTEALGDSAVLVTFTGEGHGQLLASTCVTEIEAAVLADGEVPDEGTVCDPDPDIERPDWWDDLPVPEGIDEIFDSPELSAALGLAPTQIYSEMRTSSLEPEEVLEAYSEPLEDAGFSFILEQEPVPGFHSSVYAAPNGDIFSVFAIGPEGFASDPSLEGLDELVPEGKTLVLLLRLPD